MFDCRANSAYQSVDILPRREAEVSFIQPVRQWVKRRDDPLADAAYRLATGARQASLPSVPGLHAALYGLHRAVAGA
jgi:hypothetical protein